MQRPSGFYTEEFWRFYNSWDGKFGAAKPENLKVGALRVVNNRFIERFVATAHPLFPIWALFVSAYFLYTGVASGELALGRIAWIYGIGVLGWSLVEYLAHRFVMHPQGIPQGARRMRGFFLHGYHHEFPQDAKRLVAPLSLVAPFALFLIPGCFLLFGRFEGGVLFGGFLLGYLAYDWIHFYTHHFFPKKGIGRFLVEHHAIHHYVTGKANFGISNPLWDFVFFTYESKASLAKKKAAARAARPSVEQGPSGPEAGL